MKACLALELLDIKIIFLKKYLINLKKITKIEDKFRIN
jgi:hypothetical protein